ncbi:MAG: radical SAM protein [Pseudomonadales bacterium]|nr:radical SAM protein [Pseudomonadales bacterium]
MNVSEDETRFFELLATTPKVSLATEVIGKIPEEKILSPRESSILEREKRDKFSLGELNVSKLVVVLKATRLCNLRCTYCNSWAEGPGNTMSFEVLVKSLKQIIGIPNVTRLEFVWHGGEVTMLKPKFFKKLIWLQQNLKRKDQQITNSIQSNATNFSTEWLEFLRATGMSVGISIDGPPAVHDMRRITSDGLPTSNLVRNGIQQLRSYGIPYGALVVVDRYVRDSGPEQLFEYFKSIQLYEIDFLNIVPDNRTGTGDPLQEDFIPYDEYIEFLTKAFEVWWDSYREIIEVTMFTDFVKLFRKETDSPAHCYWAGNCSNEVITLEANGDVSPCDKYIDNKDHIYGSLLNNDLALLLENAKHHQETTSEEKKATELMSNCKWFSVCNGGCPHDRLVNRRHVKDWNETCCGTGPLLERIKSQVRNDESIINVMTIPA